MPLGPLVSFILAFPLLAGAAGRATAPARVVIQNDTYSALLVAMADESGGETELGQAPPEFTNTLVVKEPLPTGPVRLVARLVGEREVLYRSEAVRLRPGARVRWRLPENRIDP